MSSPVVEQIDARRRAGESLAHTHTMATVYQVWDAATAYEAEAEAGNAAHQTLGRADPGFYVQTDALRTAWHRIRDEWSAAGGNWTGDDAAKLPIAHRAALLMVEASQSLVGAPSPPPPILLEAAGVTAADYERQNAHPLSQPTLYQTEAEAFTPAPRSLALVGVATIAAFGLFYYLDRRSSPRRRRA